MWGPMSSPFLLHEGWKHGEESDNKKDVWARSVNLKKEPGQCQEFAVFICWGLVEEILNVGEVTSHMVSILEKME